MYPQEKLIFDLFEEQVVKTPHRVAVICGDQCLTYQQLNEQANQLAHYLQERGVKAEVLVAICLERSLAMLVAILAVLKAGGAFVPLDAHYPRERIQFILDDTQCNTILSEKQITDSLNLDVKYTDSLIFLKNIADKLNQFPNKNLSKNSKPNSLCYVIYTSGSTGKPKGVMIEQHSLVNVILSIGQTIQLSEKDNFLALASISFDISIAEIFLPLMVGACCVLGDASLAKNPQKMIQTMEKNNITVMQAIPEIFRILFDYGWKNKRKIKILCGGEALPRDLAKKLADNGQIKAAWNFYGPTETTIWSTLTPISTACSFDYYPIGHPIANTKILILNEKFEIMPIGMAGELYISGDGLARGYLNQPKLTKKLFIENLLLKTDDPALQALKGMALRWYRTGDLVQQTEEGNIRYIGRVDNQVKVRGFRIELEEIEAALMQYPSIVKSVVVCSDVEGEKNLVAYYTKKSNKEEGVAFSENLRSALLTKLPAYMLPNFFIELKQLPTLPNGKIDRKLLASQNRKCAFRGIQSIKPRDEVELKLAEIWSHVLQVDSIGINENFFLLGGHSINAINMLSRVNRLFAIELAINTIIENNTIEKLAAIVKKTEHSTESFFLTFKSVRKKRNLLLSSGQQRLLFLQQYENKPIYNIPFAFILSGELDRLALENSFKFLMNRHQALRACFENRKKAPVFHIENTLPFDLKVENLDKKRVAKVLEEEATLPFSLNISPLMRVKLFRLNKNEHVLMITLHHIISDGRSIELMSQEINACYAAYLNKKKPKLKKLTMQYLDFIALQKSVASKEKIQRQLDYWKDKLRCPSHLNMPTDFSRPAKQSYEGDCYRFNIDEGLFEKINMLSIKNNVTLFMTVLAVFTILLSRYSGQDDIIIGTPMDNRDLLEAQNIFGFFINTLVLRHDLSMQPSFSALLEQVKKNCLEAYANQHLPFEQLLDALEIERSVAYHPLFQVMFVWQNHSCIEKLVLPGLVANPIPVDTHLAKFDLSFECLVQDSQLACSIEYSTDLYQRNTLQRMAEHFEQLLRSIVDNPTQSIHALPLLTEGEKRKILVSWNCPVKLALTPQKIHQRFAEQARRTPDNTALIYENAELNYHALDQKSTQLACLIQAYYKKLDKPNAGEGIFIGLCVDRSFDMIIGILGILKAGAAYVPLDPNLPTERLKFIIEDADCLLILTQEKIKQKINKAINIGEEERGILCLNNKEFIVPSTHLPPLQGSADFAYVIYTSGTTGNPKGVKQTHHNVQRLLAVTQEKFNFNHHDIWTLFHSYMFDFSVWEIWGSLLYGGCLVIPSLEQVRDPALFYPLLMDKKVTVLNQTPSVFQALMQEDHTSGKRISTLRYVIFGGEALKVENLVSWWDKYGDIHPRLINMYGITETTVHVTYKLVTKDDLRLQAASNVGRPLEDFTAYVVDKLLNLTPIGIPGELLIGNAGLAEGYLNRPELTHEKFIESPFLSLEEKTEKKLAGEEIRLYRTGDLVRWREEGSLEYLGRIDNQVKLRGFRIELDEIEVALNKHSGIQQAVVQVIKQNEIKQLVAYYLPKKNKSVTAYHLKNYLKKKLPSYMVPHLLVAIEKIPLTINMKIDFKALQQKAMQFSVASDLGDGDAQETAEVEKILIDIWRDVLQIAYITAADNFFHIGGDSMSSIRIVYAAKEKSLRFSVSDIFQYQTIRVLAKKIREQCERKSKATSDTIRPFSLLTIKDIKKLPKNIEDAYPQAALQSGMLYHSIASPLAAVYLDVFSYYIFSTYIEESFRQAIDFVVSENPILRTSFEMDSFEEPIQMIHRNITVPISVIDLQHLSQEQQESALDAWMACEKLMPFDHRQAPLFRIGIHLLAKDKFVFSFAFHHAILDGWSVATFVTKLLKKYTSLITHKEKTEDSIPNLNYNIFIQLERQASASIEYKEFWKNELADFQFTHIMAWPGEKQHDSMLEVEIPISHELSNALQGLAKNLNVSLDMVLLAAHIKLLSILSNSEDITTGVVFNGRPEIENSEKMLGLFLNSLPFRQRLSDGSWRELILSTSAIKTHLYPYRHYPLMQIYKDIGSNDLFDILFYFTNFHVYKELEKEKSIHIDARVLYERTNFPLVFSAEINQDDLSLSCILKCQKKIYNRKQIEFLAQYYQKIFNSIVDDSDCSHQAFNLLLSEEKNKLLNNWNSTEKNYTQYISSVDLFEEQVKKYPDNTAVIFANDHLTYQQLNKKSNQLARYLHQVGVKKDIVVAVYVERSLETVIAILAIMKAGGVYLPLDLNYPEKRIEFMLDDTACRFILSKKSSSSNLPKKYSNYLIFLDDSLNGIDLLPDETLKINADVQDLAYIIYTSGSTGQPKGVMLEQHSLVNLLCYVREKIKLNSEDVFLALASISFDISIAELLLPLVVGACCVVGDKLMAKDPQRIMQVIKEHNVRVMQATPTLWRMLFDYSWENPSNVKILSTGEALPQDLARKIIDHSTSAWNLYGPTEITIWASLCQITKKHLELNHYPIGMPIANTKIFVLTKNNQLSPVGVTGELCISGSGLARGYLNKMALTKEKFIENLFLTAEDPELKMLNNEAPRLYRTGDLAQWMPDGNICYIGRIDNQIKMYGYRIEPGEIEFFLSQHKKIQQAAIVMEKQDEQEYLIAYMVLRKGCFFEDSKELNDFLIKKLPHFMLPKKIIILDHLPVSVNGKLDKQQLKTQVAVELVASHRLYIPPTTREQKQLAKIWSEVLHCEKISREDNFFDLGGNSILTLKMINRVEGVFKISLSIQHVIELPSLKKLSAKILSLKNNRGKVVMQNTIRFTKQMPDPIVILQNKGAKTPLFLIHPVGGGVFYYLPLVKALGQDRPVYGIQDPGIEAQDLLFSSLKEMASFYILAIKRYQAKGPYCIGGSSFGANVAVEMARQMTDQGDALAFIGLFDGIAKYPDEVVNNREFFDSRLRSQIPYLHDQLPDANIPQLFLELHWHRQQIMDAHTIPKLTDLNLTLFKAIEIMDVLKPIKSDANLWDHYRPKSLEIYKVPGDHLTMHFEPHIWVLAKRVKECLAKAEKLGSHV